MPANCQKNVTEPVWGSSEPEDLSPEQRAWLLHQSSMTIKLKANCSHLSVNMIEHAWKLPLSSELKTLNWASDELAFIREAELKCQGKVWIYARTIVPKPTFEAHAEAFLGMGDTPLGEYLFAQPDLQRSRFEFAQIQSCHKFYAAATQHLSTKPNAILARRSLFYLAEHPLLLTELFLPTIPGF